MALTKTAENALLEYESSVTEYEEALTDSGDHQIFTGTPDVWSNNGAYAPEILPDGVVSGTNILTPHADDNKLTVGAFTAYVSGVLKTYAGGTVSITRASTGTHVINSIVFDGTDVTAVKGTESTSFLTTRGGNGGPPYIAVAKIELGQVKTSSQTAAAILASEIFQSATNGTQERYDYPTFYTPNTLGDGNSADTEAQQNAYVKFSKALVTSHTGDTVKGVYAVLNEPDFTEIEVAEAWKPATETPSTSSKQWYNGVVIGTSSKSLSAASFNIAWSNPTTHPLRKLDGKNLTFRFYPDKNVTTEYELCQGIIGIAPTYETTADMGGTVTIAANRKVALFG